LFLVLVKGKSLIKACLAKVISAFFSFRLDLPPPPSYLSSRVAAFCSSRARPKGGEGKAIVSLFGPGQRRLLNGPQKSFPLTYGGQDGGGEENGLNVAPLIDGRLAAQVDALARRVCHGLLVIEQFLPIQISTRSL